MSTSGRHTTATASGDRATCAPINAGIDATDVSTGSANTARLPHPNNRACSPASNTSTDDNRTPGSVVIASKTRRSRQPTPRCWQRRRRRCGTPPPRRFRRDHQSQSTFGQTECQIHTGGAGVGGQRGDLQIFQVQRDGRLPGEVPRQHHLDQRRMRKATYRVQALDQHLEGHILVFVGSQAARSHLLQKFCDGGVSPDRPSTNVLTKNPTNSSSAGSRRPAIGNPTATSVLELTFDNNAAKAACTTMKVVVWCSRATLATRCCSSAANPRRLGHRGDRRPAGRAGRSATARARGARPTRHPRKPTGGRCGCLDRRGHQTGRAATACSRRTAQQRREIGASPALRLAYANPDPASSARSTIRRPRCGAPPPPPRARRRRRGKAVPA